MADDDLLTQREFAELIGVSSRTMNNLRNAGLSEYCVVRGNSVRVRRAEGVQWYVRYREAIAGQNEEERSLAQAELDLAVAKAATATLELERKKGALVELVQVEEFLGDVFARVAARLDSLPPKMAQGLTGKTVAKRRKEAQALIDEVRDELRGDDFAADDAGMDEAA